MNSRHAAVVITTINAKTGAIKAYENMRSISIVIVGDKKTPNINNGANSRYIAIDEQNDLGFKIAEQLPYNHYSRKNIGYLVAMQSGAEVIYDTDDDNAPMANWFVPEFQSALNLSSAEHYTNVYKYFTGKKVWPRGLPLTCINAIDDQVVARTECQDIAVWQGMANGDPDVDAIYRLIDNEPVTFEEKSGVYLKKGLYCPFNSQNTFWKKEFFPLLYLPSTTSFRFTDILRGYIAQRLIWDDDHCLGFMEATVFQDRNQHDYMNDFKDEVEVYLNVGKVVDILENVTLSGSLCNKLKIVYEELCAVSIVSPDELGLLDLWIIDYVAIAQGKL